MQSASVGIRDAKMHFSKYIKMVQKGTEVIITDRGRPVGKIVPIQDKDRTLEERIRIRCLTKDLSRTASREQDGASQRHPTPTVLIEEPDTAGRTLRHDEIRDERVTDSRHRR